MERLKVQDEPSERSGGEGRGPGGHGGGDVGKQIRNQIRSTRLSIGELGRSLLAIEKKLHRARKPELYAVDDHLTDSEELLAQTKKGLRVLAALCPDDGPVWPNDVDGEPEK
jgi:hypothetical protein